MTTSSNNTTTNKSGIPMGIVFVILGLIAFFAPIYTAYSITVILGVVFIASSIIYFITELANKTHAFISTLFFSLLGLVIGIVLISHGLTLLSILVGIWFLFLSFALFHRAADAGMSVGAKTLWIIAAIAALLFAISLFIGWPFTGIGILGSLVGIVLVIQGIACIIHSCGSCNA